MCGIAGFWTRDGNREDMSRLARRMCEALSHRGPDDAGVWVEDATGVAMAHRRLSILDLSPEGHQPMVSASGRYVLVYNGEIYNYHELRAEIENTGAAPRWRGHSDTEVLGHVPPSGVAG